MAAHKASISCVPPATAPDVHPLADIFPMLAGDDLAMLADDIKAKGLLHPIVLDADGRIVDGRNRHRACEIAGVEPMFRRLGADEDVAGLVVSANLARRDLTRGQKAIALAMIYPEPETGHSRRKGAQTAVASKMESSGVAKNRLSDARLILRADRLLAEAVLAGRDSFDTALTAARVKLNENAEADTRFAELTRFLPDIADQVTEERLTLAAGMEELNQRRRRCRSLVAAAISAVQLFRDLPGNLATIEAGLAAIVHNPLLLDCDDVEPADPLHGLTDDDINDVIAVAERLRAMKARQAQ